MKCLATRRAQFVSSSIYTVFRKKGATKFFAVTFTNIDRFS